MVNLKYLLPRFYLMFLSAILSSTGTYQLLSTSFPIPTFPDVLVCVFESSSLFYIPQDYYLRITIYITYLPVYLLTIRYLLLYPSMSLGLKLLFS